MLFLCVLVYFADQVHNAIHDCQWHCLMNMFYSMCLAKCVLG